MKMSLMDKYPRIYAMLKRAGHSPAKAYTIILDAHRKDEYSLHWVRILQGSKFYGKEKAS